MDGNIIRVDARNPWPMARRLLMATALLLAVGSTAHAEVHLPNGDYRTSMTDLKVKVLGGYVSIERTWQAINLNRGEYRWSFNPAWSDLVLEIDSTDSSLRSVSRNGAKFERQGDDLYVLKESDRAYFIQAERDATGARSGLRWSDRLGNAIAYDAAGRIARYTDRNGVAVTFTRDPSTGLIQSVSDGNTPAKTVLTFAYSGTQVSAISDLSGRTVHYDYTGTDLTDVVDVLGHSWTYGYSNGLMTTQTDPEHHTTTIEYAGNRVVKLTDPQTNATTWTYDYDRGTRQYQVKETSPDGKATYGTYNADGTLIDQETGTRRITHLVKDSSNVDIRTDERGLPTRTEYDANRNPIKVTYPDGSSTTATYDGAHSLPLTRTDELGVVTNYTYDPNGNLTTLTEAVGLPEQRITTATYNAYGQRLTQTVKGTTADDDTTTTWTYDDAGNIHTLTDAEHNTTTFAYDVMGNVTGRIDARGYFWQTLTNAQGWLTDQIDPLDHATVMTYDSLGNRTTLTDPEHNTTTYTYTANNQLETTTDPLGGVNTTHYTKDGMRKDESDANNVTTSYAYDSDGRLTTIVDGAGNATIMIYGRDCHEQPVVTVDGLVAATKYPTYCEEYKYDNRDRRMQVIQVLPGANSAPDTRRTFATGYDAKGHAISTSDPLGHTTLTAYDALDRVKASTDAIGGITAYTYDARDNLHTVTDANENTHTFGYDKFSRVKSETRPLGETIHYDYDEVGNPLTRTSSNGERRQYRYDGASRRATENQYATDNPTPSQTVTFSHDGRNLMTAYAQAGDTESSATYVYDAKGQKVDETITYGSGQTATNKTIHYAYEPNGLKKSLTYPDGTAQTSTYDKNRLKDITINGNTIRYQDYQWRVPTQVTMPGATRTLTYDALQRPTQIKSVSQGGAVIMDYLYTYDLAGNITQQETEDGAYAYTYDPLDRLTRATPPTSVQQSAGNPNGLPVEQYSYDPVHNRKTSAHQPGNWSYNANNELNTYGSGEEQQTYAYDPNGNAAKKTTGNPQRPSKTRQFIYNAAERLSEIRDNGATIATYQYDPFGRRFKKETSQGVTWFQYADEGLIAEYAPTGALQRTYGWRPSGLWGTDPVWMAETTGSSWMVNLYHNDHIGTSLALTAIAGNIAWKTRSQVFGVGSDVVSLVRNALRSPGQYYDDETGNSYNFYRDYDAVTGRYIQNDPMGIYGGINEFSYASSNPLTHIDSFGLNSFGFGLCKKDVTGSLTDLTPSGSWIANIHFKTVYINLPDGAVAAVIGRYIIASSGSFSLGIRCTVGITCCNLSTTLYLDINVNSPVFAAEYEYEEIEGIMPMRFLPKAFAAAKIAKVLYDSVKGTKEFRDWYSKNGPDELCKKVL